MDVIPSPPITKSEAKTKLEEETPSKSVETLAFEIEVLDDSEVEEAKEDIKVKTLPEKKELQIVDISGVGEKTAMLLKDGGIETLEQLANQTPEELSKIRGIGITSAKKLIYGANALKAKGKE